MPGEQLPPVVATLTGDDSDFLDMLDRDVAALRAAAGEIDGLLAGLDLGAALADSLSSANLGSLNTDELAQGLSEAMGGIGAALGSDVGTQFGDAVRGEGVTAGAELADGIAEGAAGIGDTLAQDLAAGLSADASSAGAGAGEALAESFTGTTAGLGQQVAAQVDAGLESLPSHLAALGSVSGHAMASAVESALLTLAGVAVGAAGILGAGLGSGLEARLADVLMQAGQSAGISLAAGISVGAVGSAGSAAGDVARAIEASLTDAMAEAGGPAGSALMAGVESGAQAGADTAAAGIAEALQTPLEGEMTLLGQVAGDAFTAGLGDAGAGGGGGTAGGGFAADFARREASALEQAAEQLGQQAAGSFGKGWAARNRGIPYGGVLDPDELLAMNQGPEDVFVPDMTGSQNAWVLASKTGAREAADAAWKAYGQELAGLVISPEAFLALTDTGVALWSEQVAVQAADSGEGFVHAFADALTVGMAGIDWSALTDSQAAALMAAMQGHIAEVAPEAEAAMEQVGTAAAEGVTLQLADTGSAVADALIARIVEARQAVTDQLVGLAMDAAEEGEQAGGRFATFFSQALGGIRLVFSRDPEKAAEAGAEAGRLYANAMVDELLASLGGVEQAAAEDGAASGSAFGRFFSGAAAGALGVFARDPAKVAGGEAGVEFADAMAAQLELRLGEIGAAGDAGFAGVVEAQLAEQLRIAADEATAAYEQQLSNGLAEAEAAAAARVAGLDTVEARLDAVFESIYQHGAVMSSQLAGAMTDALAGIEADTSGFTEAELAVWNEFFTTLEARGTTAAYQFAATMGSLQGKDLVGLGIGTSGAGMGAGFGKVAAEAEDAASGIGSVEKAAAGATGAFGGLSAMMSGPVGMGLFALSSFLPMLGGLFNSSAVSAADFTSAVSQDSGAVGDNTAATIQSTLAKTNLADISQQLGLSQAQLIEYAAGEKDVQDKVTAAYEAKEKAIQDTAGANQKYGSITKASGDEAGNAANQLYAQKQALDAVTGAVQQAIVNDAANSAALLAAEQTTQIYDATVNALGQSLLLNVQQTKMANQATAEFGKQVLFAESSVSYMNAAMGASEASLQQSALTSSYASVGLLNLGQSQTALNAELAAGETQYAEAQAGAQAYGAALTSLNGSYSSLYGAEASFTGALANLTSSLKANGTSLDANSAKGYQNAQAAKGAAQAAIQASIAVYQNEVSTKGSTAAWNDANATLAKQKQEFIEDAEKAGANKNAVKALADELFKIPKSVKTQLHVDDSSVTHALSTTQELITALKNMPAGTIPTIGTRAVPGKASGGDVAQGQLYRINEDGGEGYFVPPANGYVVPHAEMAQLTPAYAGGGGGAAPQVTVHVYLNGSEISAEMRAEVQQYKTHNSTTGFN